MNGYAGEGSDAARYQNAGSLRSGTTANTLEQAEMARGVPGYSALLNSKLGSSEQPLHEQVAEIEKLAYEALSLVGTSADRLFGSQPEPNEASNVGMVDGNLAVRLSDLRSTMRRLLGQASRLNRIG